MIDDLIPIDTLQEGAAYCVLMSARNRESIVLRGKEVKDAAKTSRDFQRFGPMEAIGLPDYVRVQVDDRTHLAVWLDPTRPELRSGATEQPIPLAVEHVNATLRILSLADILETSGRRMADALFPQTA